MCRSTSIEREQKIKAKVEAVKTRRMRRQETSETVEARKTRKQRKRQTPETETDDGKTIR